MRRLVLLVLCIAFLTACGAGSSEPEKAATTKPPRVYTVAELERALPTQEQVPTAIKKTSTCPGDKTCEKGAVSVAFELRPPGDSQDVERLAKNAFTSDHSSLAALPEPDAAAATASIEKFRTSMSRYDGAFENAFKSLGENRYQPGEKGTGTLADATVDGWKGFRVSRVQQFSGYDGDGSRSVEFNSTKYDITFLMVSDNRTVLTAYVAVAAEARPKGASSTIADQLASDYIKRLG